MLSAPKWWELRRDQARHDGPRSRSAVGLAEELQALGEDLVQRITDSEAEQVAVAGTPAGEEQP